MNVILFGPPGAGKGTQASHVSHLLKIPHISTGDIFRRHLKDGTELGKLANSYMERGELVPDRVVCDIVASRLLETDCAGGALLDGFPRTVEQAQILHTWLRDRGAEIDAVVNLEVPDQMLVARLSGRRTCLTCGATYHVQHNPPATPGTCDRCSGDVVQRKDDSEDTVRTRLETYRRETSPVLGWLEDRVRVHYIDGSVAIDDVRASVHAALASGAE